MEFDCNVRIRDGLQTRENANDRTFLVHDCFRVIGLDLRPVSINIGSTRQDNERRNQCLRQ